MFTLLKFKTNDFNKCKFNSFISFIFSFVNIGFFHSVCNNDVIHGICGVI